MTVHPVWWLVMEKICPVLWGGGVAYVDHEPELQLWYARPLGGQDSAQ